MYSVNHESKKIQKIPLSLCYKVLYNKRVDKNTAPMATSASKWCPSLCPVSPKPAFHCTGVTCFRQWSGKSRETRCSVERLTTRAVRLDLSSMDADAYLKNEFQRRRTRGLCQLGAHSAWTARPPAVPVQPSSNSGLWWREGEGTPISREAFTAGFGPWKLRPSSPVSHCYVIFWHCRPWPSDPKLSPSGVQMGHSPRWAQRGFLARIK